MVSVSGIRDTFLGAGGLPSAAGAPSFAADPVAGVTGPDDAVGAGIAVGVGYGRGAVGPEGVEVAIVRAGAAGRGLARDQLAGFGCGSGEDAGGGGEGEEQRLERNHVGERRLD